MSIYFSTLFVGTSSRTSCVPAHAIIFQILLYTNFSRTYACLRVCIFHVNELLFVCIIRLYHAICPLFVTCISLVHSIHYMSNTSAKVRNYG